jgi:hypothetical protein
VTITAPAKTKHVHAMLDIAAKFPRMTADGSPASDSHAQTWLLQECSADLLKQLSQLLSIEPPASDADGVSKCALSHSPALFIFCDVVLQVVWSLEDGAAVHVLWNRQLARRLQRLGATAAHAAAAA